jgi:GTP-binding protein EngB required for normal cell division
MNEVLASTAADLAPQDNALAAILGRGEAALEAAVGAGSPLSAQLRVLRRRLAEERLQMAVLGQFKRGKSTFINALLGAAVLPTGVVPLTALATFIAWGLSPRVVVLFKGGDPRREFAPQTIGQIRDTLFRFVAEEANPENRLGVERVELFFPADLLADGTVLIDTPGVGSTLKHNTEAAFQVLPECDAVLFVVSADPPITELEIDYLRRLKSETTRIFYVVNKADYLQPEDRRTLVDFLQKTLAEKALIDAEPQIFCVSARDGLTARENGAEQLLAASGIGALEDHLVRSLANEKRRWLDQAVRSKTVDVLTHAAAELDLRQRALAMPLEELAAKSHAFQEALRSIEDQRRVTRDLLAGEHRRLREDLDLRTERLRRDVAPALVRVLDASLSGAAAALWAGAGRRALAVALQREFEAARKPLTTAFAVDTGAVLKACERRVDDLVQRVRQIAAQVFDVPLRTRVEHDVFELGEDPYWVTKDQSASLIPDAGRLIDRFLPLTLRRQRVRRRLIKQGQELVVRNGENLRWAILRGLDETFRKATARFEERLDEAVSATRNVIQDALDRRRDQSLTVEPELSRLAQGARILAAIGEELRAGRASPAAVNRDRTDLASSRDGSA